jgi:hypothetical protein
MELSITTPALFFSAISLLMLAYTNRFLTLAALIRNLHSQYLSVPDDNIYKQIQNLRKRLHMIKNMQLVGISSLLMSVLSMFLIYINIMILAHIVFGIANILLILSLILSVWEILISANALDIHLSDIEARNNKN